MRQTRDAEKVRESTFSTACCSARRPAARGRPPCSAPTTGAMEQTGVAAARRRAP